MPRGQGTSSPLITPSLHSVYVCLCAYTCHAFFLQFPLGQIRLAGACVEELNSDEDSKNGQSFQYAISIQTLNQSPTYLHVDSPHEKVRAGVNLA